MPNLTPDQLKQMSLVPGTRFFVWHATPLSDFYHMMLGPDGRALSLRTGWVIHSDEGVLSPATIQRRFVEPARHTSWVEVSQPEFSAVMDNSPLPAPDQGVAARIRYIMGDETPFNPTDWAVPPVKRSDPRLKTNHKLGAPKGKLP